MKRANTYTIYFGQSQLLFCSEQPSHEYAVVVADRDEDISRAKIVKKVETDKFVAVVSTDVVKTFERFASEFRWVEAAGGAVVDDAGRLLMIRLRERWDLPKGHIEAGESGSEAALREVAEETGIRAELVGEEPLAVTFHAYDTYGHWELKRTEWWQMQANGGTLQNQTEEGITEAVWAAANEREEMLKESYPTIKLVVEALEEKIITHY